MRFWGEMGSEVSAYGPTPWAPLGRSFRAHCFARNDEASFKAVSHARRLTGTQKAWKCAKRLGVRQQSCRFRSGQLAGRNDCHP
jgi:hypothetical protein